MRAWFPGAVVPELKCTFEYVYKAGQSGAFGMELVIAFVIFPKDSVTPLKV